MELEHENRIRNNTAQAIELYNSGNYEECKRIVHVIIAELEGENFDSQCIEFLDPLHQMSTSLFNLSTEFVSTLRYLCQSKGIVPINFDTGILPALESCNQKALISDFTDLKEDQLGQKIIIVCQPKTGSTFLHQALSKLTNYQTLFSTFASGANDHQPYLPYIIRMAKTNTISQEHYKATIGTIQLLEAFNYRAIILVRNIFDALVSLRDMMLGDSFGSIMAELEYNLPDMNSAKQLDAIISRFAHWYVEFYASWARIDKKGTIPCTFITYETLMNNKVEVLNDLISFCGVQELPRNEIELIIDQLEADKTKIRFNQGSSGRGLDLMTKEQVATIKRIPEYYPDIDFSPIGL